jgi:hypothetical protein
MKNFNVQNEECHNYVLFAFKAISSAISFSIMATSIVPIVCTYVSKTCKWPSKPYRKDCHGRDFDCSLAPTKLGV